MAFCTCCKREMLRTKGCKKIKIDTKLHGKMNPIKVGDPDDLYFGQPDAICGDCGAYYGHYHHPGCDMEVCPVCKGQLNSCDCTWTIDTSIPKKEMEARAQILKERIARNVFTGIHAREAEQELAEMWEYLGW